ncbi:unnamed protein product [Peronospora belbahrii]|uniref:Uncharacterized protein n=1 Tax=Peronospora belbahrii TaxID=622444 RepID=A0ABN8CQF3_9STRA|nr:unnamed protein product [Peronospora belbahrii]
MRRIASCSAHFGIRVKQLSQRWHPEASRRSLVLTIRSGKEEVEFMDAAAHMTYNSTKRAQAVGIQKGSAHGERAIIYEYERDFKNEGNDAQQKMGEAMRKQSEALEDSGVWRYFKRSPSNIVPGCHDKTDAHVSK